MAASSASCAIPTAPRKSAAAVVAGERQGDGDEHGRECDPIVERLVGGDLSGLLGSVEREPDDADADQNRDDRAGQPEAQRERSDQRKHADRQLEARRGGEGDCGAECGHYANHGGRL